MRRQNSEQFYKLRNFWKLTKESQQKEQETLYNSNMYQGSKDLYTHKYSNDTKIQQK